jgi:aminomethyltransferase
MAIGTPFHARTSELNTSLSWKHWSGYFVAKHYDDFWEPEYQAVRNGAALIDVSPLYKYDIRGKDAVRLLDRLITRSASKIKVGQVIYTPWCDDKGKVLQDGTIQRLGDELYRLASVDPCLHWFEDNTFGLDVELEDVTERMGALALQGPRSLRVMNRISNKDMSSLRFFGVTDVELGGVPVVVSRTGYTGDLGYEIWVGVDDAERLWDALVQAGEGQYLVPAGMQALDLSRIEAGLPLIDVDFWNAEKALTEDQKSSPFELGLGWTVNLTKPNFVGKQALIEEKHRGTPRFFVGLEVSWNEIERIYVEEGLPPEPSQEASRVGVPVYFGSRQVGKATSSCWSKQLKKFIALTSLDAPYVKPGSMVDLEMTVEYRRKRAAAKVVQLPFFDPPRKRA